MPTFPPDELALLAAIHAAPRDDTPRLVYADWLEEHGEAEYAATIRWQVSSSVTLGYNLRKGVKLVEARSPSGVVTPAHAIPPGVLERMRPLPKAVRGLPHVVYQRGLPVVDIPLTSPSVVGFDGLRKYLRPCLRLHALGLDLNHLTDPVEALLANEVFRRSDGVRLTGGPGLERFVAAAAETGALSRLRAIYFQPVSSGSISQLAHLLGVGPPERGGGNWFVYCLGRG